MDFVPSPGLMNSHYSTSPYASIYDQDKPDIWATICKAGATNIEAVSAEDLNVLDEKLEDSTLHTLLTSEMMHNLQAASLPVNTDFQWGGKADGVTVSRSSNTVGPNPTLTELNMEPDMSIVDDILSMDSDLLCSVSNSPFNELSSMSSDSVSTKTLTPSPAICQNANPSKVAPTNGSTDRSKAELSNFLRYSRENFPPRSTQNPPVGVVAPVKKEQDTILTTDPIKKEKDLVKTESPNLQKLLLNKDCKESAGSEKSLATSKQDTSAQIVPMSSDVMSIDCIKSEPLSPEKVCKKRCLTKEKSTEETWKDIQSFMFSPSPEPEPPTKKRKRNNSGSSAHMSDDEDEDDDERSVYDGKDYEDDSDDDYSDIDADLTRINPSECESLVTTGKKQKQFFWQYNVQSKGPKGTRLKLAVDQPADPHAPNSFEDPVFDEGNTSVAGIRHGGKARKGDGNEITPNPMKLFRIGHQLLRLSRQINSFQLGPDVPLPKRNESKKEKNKLASRACRLKKKAQHEANKIKLFGVEREHSQLNQVLQFILPHLRERAQTLMAGNVSRMEPLSQILEKHMAKSLNDKIAGHTVDFVNSVILCVESGNNSGGLALKKKLKS